MKIKNRQEILSCGDIKSKEILLDITEQTLEKLDGYKRIKMIMRLEGDILHVGNCSWDLSKKKNVYLVGAGKACNAMAMAVDEILGDKLTAGYAIVKIKEDNDVFRKTKIFVGGHPLPNEEGLKACKEILSIVDNASADDLFIGVISGGSSALMGCPVEGITLEDEIATTDVILKSGAGILELNAVRRHISQMNGGMLAKRIQARGAELIGIAINDAIGFAQTKDISIPFENYSGTPIGPDFTTLEEARRVIKDYDLAHRLPRSVVDYLMHCSEQGETPKSFPENKYFVLNTLPDSCVYAKEFAEEMGLNAMILTSYLEGESKEAGTFFASLAREIQAYHRPIKPPCVVICSGETTTQILDNSKIKGHGGPSQELVSSFAITAAKAKGIAMLSIDSEGTDGSTSAAGGITDSQTYPSSVEKNISLYEALRGHATNEALEQLKGLVITGNTGTNLCDFNIMYVPELDNNN